MAYTSGSGYAAGGSVMRYPLPPRPPPTVTTTTPARAPTSPHRPKTRSLARAAKVKAEGEVKSEEKEVVVLEE